MARPGSHTLAWPSAPAHNYTASQSLIICLTKLNVSAPSLSPSARSQSQVGALVKLSGDTGLYSATGPGCPLTGGEGRDGRHMLYPVRIHDDKFTDL